MKFRMFRLVVMTIIMSTLIGCATSRERFPDFGEVAKTQTEIPVVLDVFAYRDLAGTTRGYNQEVIDKTADKTIAELENVMIERGFTINVIAQLNGLGTELKEGEEYVVSEEWKSTDVAYSGIDFDAATNPWLTSANRDFLLTLKSTARGINHKAKKDQVYSENKLLEEVGEEKSTEEVTPLRISELPVPAPLLDDINSDIVMFVLMDGRLQRADKSLAKGVLFGAASAALTGGTIISTGPGGTRLKTDVIVFNTKTHQILWHSRSEGAPSLVQTAVESAVGTVLSGYPNREGVTRWEKKRKPKENSQHKAN